MDEEKRKGMENIDRGEDVLSDKTDFKRNFMLEKMRYILNDNLNTQMQAHFGSVGEVNMSISWKEFAAKKIKKEDI